MTASNWPGYLVLAALVTVAVGCLFYALSGAIVLHRVVSRGRPARPAHTAWVVERRSPVSGHWGGWGGPYATAAAAFVDFAETIADPARDRVAFQVVEVTTTYRLAAHRRPLLPPLALTPEDQR